MNLEICEFKEKIVAVINESKLPSMVKQMAFNDIKLQLDILVVNDIAAEKAVKEKAGD
jgi:hypothetical protein